MDTRNIKPKSKSKKAAAELRKEPITIRYRVQGNCAKGSENPEKA